MDTKADPVIEDLIKWLKENLPPDAKEEDIFKKVRKMQKVYDVLVGLAFEEFYQYAMGVDQRTETRQQEEDRHQQQHHHQEDRDTDTEIELKQDKQNDDCPTKTTLDEAVSEKLTEIKDYIILNEEKSVKTQKLNASRAKLDLRKDQYELINSIRLDNCMDLISRYNRLMSKK